MRDMTVLTRANQLLLHVPTTTLQSQRVAAVVSGNSGVRRHGARFGNSRLLKAALYLRHSVEDSLPVTCCNCRKVRYLAMSDW